MILLRKTFKKSKKNLLKDAIPSVFSAPISTWGKLRKILCVSVNNIQRGGHPKPGLFIFNQSII